MLKSVAMQFKMKIFFKKNFLGGVLNTKLLEKDPTNTLLILLKRAEKQTFSGKP